MVLPPLVLEDSFNIVGWVSCSYQYALVHVFLDISELLQLSRPMMSAKGNVLYCEKQLKRGILARRP